jgi:hypothetical protein
MTSIAIEITTEATPSTVWDAIRDVGALHTRLVPGFVVATELVPGGRRKEACPDSSTTTARFKSIPGR